MIKHSHALILFGTVIAAATISVATGFTFTEPSGPPTGNNADPPINVGTDNQTKEGTLTVNDISYAYNFCTTQGGIYCLNSVGDSVADMGKELSAGSGLSGDDYDGTEDVTWSVDTSEIATQDYVDNKFNSSLTIDGNLTVNGGLRLDTGTRVNQFTTNVENNDNSVPTGQAVQNYVSDNAGGVDWANPVRISGVNNKVINNVAFCMINFNSQNNSGGNHDVRHLGGNSWRVRLSHQSGVSAAYCFPFK